MKSPASGPSFRLPAEWEPHQATLLTWPHNPTDWPGKLRDVRASYVELIRHLSTHEPVWLLTGNEKRTGSARNQLERAGVSLDDVRFLNIETNRSWIRDYGPISVYNHQGTPTLLNFQFNGWARFPAHAQDNAVTDQLAPLLNLPTQNMKWQDRPVVLEGGSIDSNGDGILLTTRECLLSDTKQKRNPSMTQTDLEALFASCFGTRQVIWLGHGIEGDDTHGHVDDITRFTSPNTMITMVEPNRKDANYQALADNLALLKKETYLTTIEIPMPQAAYYRDFRIPVSYANFLIANGCVLVPIFNDVNDREALSILDKLFPERHIIGIDSRDILTGLGGIHCVSMQVPA